MRDGTRSMRDLRSCQESYVFFAAEDWVHPYFSVLLVPFNSPLESNLARLCSFRFTFALIPLWPSGRPPTLSGIVSSSRVTP